jgi:hypothetical protein
MIRVRTRAVATHGAGGQPCQGVRDTGGDAREAPDAYATRNQGWNEVLIMDVFDPVTM